MSALPRQGPDLSLTTALAPDTEHVFSIQWMDGWIDGHTTRKTDSGTREIQETGKAEEERAHGLPGGGMSL